MRTAYNDQSFTLDNGKVILHSPLACPLADSFLWNQKMMAQVNCRGYVKAQYLSPEPSQYSQGPVFEATTFMMPEQGYYQHHPGRYFYLLDRDTDQLFSAPYEPVRTEAGSFQFIAEDDAVRWEIIWQGLSLSIAVRLADNQPLEYWSLTIRNLSERERRLKLVPCFSLGYQSWMNQQARFCSKTRQLKFSSVFPWQLMEDYQLSNQMSKQVIFSSEKDIDGYCLSQAAFEGEGGLQRPDAIFKKWPEPRAVNYQNPIAVVNHELTLAAKQADTFRYRFGIDNDQSGSIDWQHTRLFSRDKNWQNAQLKIETPAPEFDQFVNHWLPRQLHFLTEQNRFCNDPQTRNFLQDQMGTIYFDKDKAKQALLLALSQQRQSGAMPDGILLSKAAKLKYINQVPHTDHCVWLFYFIEAWLSEHADYTIFDCEVGFYDSEHTCSVAQHFQLAADWLIKSTDSRGLSLMAQGDWCDPMNMVGAQGKGVSIWLTMAASWALQIWQKVCKKLTVDSSENEPAAQIMHLNQSIAKYGWDENWYARAINDEQRKIGVNTDREGQIFLNPQSFALLSGVANDVQAGQIIAAVEQYLMPQKGDPSSCKLDLPMMLAPAFQSMDEGIGRVTQKSPGTAENGSVYNHAVIFYILALFRGGYSEPAFTLLKAMIPNGSNYQQMGQLPVYIPNYYRGYCDQYAEDFGKSSRLFNTGTIAWYYRCLVEELTGLKGCDQGLSIEPKLPAEWEHLNVTRLFRGTLFHIDFQRHSAIKSIQLRVDGNPIEGHVISNFEGRKALAVKVLLPC